MCKKKSALNATYYISRKKIKEKEKANSIMRRVFRHSEKYIQSKKSKIHDLEYILNKCLTEIYTNYETAFYKIYTKLKNW